eukprot:7822539-Pyramimonas_sp.AAC.2
MTLGTRVPPALKGRDDKDNKQRGRYNEWWCSGPPIGFKLPLKFALFAALSWKERRVEGDGQPPPSQV